MRRINPAKLTEPKARARIPDGSGTGDESRVVGRSCQVLPLSVSALCQVVPSLPNTAPTWDMNCMFSELATWGSISGLIVYVKVVVSPGSSAGPPTLYFWFALCSVNDPPATLLQTQPSGALQL